VAVLVLFVTQLVCWTQVIFAWGFVAGRYAHSFVHCGSNNVMRRFYAFLFSNFFLVCMWGMLAWQLFTVKVG
ncbi:MAG: MAPEG family protein, partial [Betaproteobacteria bacterium]|nr:MAPEG family protein [Betaproteobacteria bacterium]